MNPSADGNAKAADPASRFVVRIHPCLDGSDFAFGKVAIDVWNYGLAILPAWRSGTIRARAPNDGAENSRGNVSASWRRRQCSTCWG